MVEFELHVQGVIEFEVHAYWGGDLGFRVQFRLPWF